MGIGKAPFPRVVSRGKGAGPSFRHARSRPPPLTNPPDASVPSRPQLPVTVLLERRETRRGRWSVPSWYLAGVVLGDGLGGGRADGVEVRAGGTPSADGPPGSAVHAWTGRAVTLYRDACERYWHALIGDRPLVYAVCREREAAPGIEPFLVTVDYDEASAFGETDALVLSTDIDPALYRRMEEFVLAHYRPQPFEKRRRKRWAAGEGDATPTRISSDAAGGAAAPGAPSGDLPGRGPDGGGPR